MYHSTRRSPGSSSSSSPSLSSSHHTISVGRPSIPTPALLPWKVVEEEEEGEEEEEEEETSSSSRQQLQHRVMQNTHANCKPCTMRLMLKRPATLPPADSTFGEGCCQCHKGFY